MPNSVGARHAVSYITETVFGTTPTTPAFLGLNHSSFDMNKKVQSVMDPSIRLDRNVVDQYQTSYTVEGQLSQPLRPTEADSLWESLLMGTWSTNVLKNGSTRKSFTFERNWADNTLYQAFTGVVASGLKLEVPNGNIVTAQWSLMGMTYTVPGASTLDADSTYAALSTATPFIETAATITEGGSALAYVTNVSLDITNGITSTNAIGTAAPSDLIPDRFVVKGTAKAYFPSAALYTKFLNNTTSTFQVAFTSGSNSITILMPKIRYSNVAVPVNGTGPVEQDIAFDAVFDSTTGATMQITRV